METTNQETPNSSKKLVIEENFDGEIVVPNDIKHLELHLTEYDDELILPKNLKYLKLRFTPKKISFPEGLKELYFYYGKSEKLDFPKSLTHLQLPFRYPHELPELPNLKFLSVGVRCPPKIILNEGLEEFHVNSAIKLNDSDNVECESPKFEINKIPSTLHTLQLPMEISIYCDLIQGDLSFFDKFKEGEYLQHFPNLKTIHYVDEYSLEMEEERDKKIVEIFQEEVKEFFSLNPHFILKNYFSKYIEDTSGYDTDDIVNSCFFCEETEDDVELLKCKNCEIYDEDNADYYCVNCIEHDDNNKAICNACESFMFSEDEEEEQN